MGDVDKLQVAEEAAAQRAEEQLAREREERNEHLRAEPLRITARKARAARTLQIARIHPGDNIRPDLPEIDELARSIREVGLLSPLIVRPWKHGDDGDGQVPKGADEDGEHFRLVAGHRRHAALTELTGAGVDGYDQVACEVREELSEAEAYALMLTENVQRIPLEPIQAARALRLLLDLNEGLDAAALARSLGLKPAWAQMHLRLLDLPAEVQERIEAGDLSVTIADLLRRGQRAGRLDEGKVRDIAEKVASGEITTAQARAAAAPPPRPNTQAPRTVSASAIDERELVENESASPAPPWSRSAVQTASGPDVTRPATPLTAPAPIPLDSRPGPATTSPPDSSELSFEERIDAYLLGRMLTEWASDEQLDRIGIDRVQGAAFAEALAFDERIDAIRRISWELMQEDRAPASAR